MDPIKVEVTGNIARIVERPAKVTSGTVGLPVKFTFDSQWDGLEKMAVFRAGKVIKDAVNPGAETTVPWEVLERPGVWLSIGVYGTNEDSSVVIPTIWANVCVIHNGADPDGDPGVAPTNPVWMDLINTLKGIDSAYKVAVANGFEGTEEAWLKSLKGVSGVYVGPGEMPEGYNVQIDPEGEAFSADEFAELFSHVANKNNPHKVTAKQVGAAPSNAIVDMSKGEDLINGFADGMCYDLAWAKRIDGTFSLSFGFYFYYDGSGSAYICEGLLPFDILDFEYTTLIYESTETGCFDAGTVDVEIFHDSENLATLDYITISMIFDDAVIKAFEASGVDCAEGDCFVKITGKWREG